MVLVLNMWDVAKKQGIQIDIEKLKQLFPDITIVATNARLGLGKERILNALNAVKKRNGKGFMGVAPSSNKAIDDKIKRQEAKLRKEKIEIVIHETLTKSNTSKQSRLDAFFVHPLWGLPFFLGCFYSLCFSLYFHLRLIQWILLMALLENLRTGCQIFYPAVC